MPTYAVILGHQPGISLAELRACIPDLSGVMAATKNIALFTCSTDVRGDFVDRLGGTLLLAREVTKNASPEDIPQILEREIMGVKGKVTFSIRTFDIPRPVVHDLYRRCKAHLKRLGRSCRYIGTERKPAAAVLLHKAGVASGKHGCELFLLGRDRKLWVGRTIGAHDIEEYVKRDIGKPARDMRAGIMPPKLAQVLLNLAQWLTQSPLLRVYDPFCGSGVIPMECLLRGFAVYASDSSQRAISACERNLEWLRKERKILKKDVPSAVWKQDATKALDEGKRRATPLRNPPDVLVTETALGPPLRKQPSIKEAQKLRTESEKLQSAFLEATAKTLPGVPLVLTWPVWQTSAGPVVLEHAWDVLHRAGYMAILPPGVEPSIKGRVSIIYSRPDQFVSREIVLLKPRKR